MNTVPKLKREVFATSRLLESCSEKELVAQTGTPVMDWPIYLFKKLIDIALDACEQAGQAPEVNIQVGAGNVIISDNRPGIHSHWILDFSAPLVASSEARVSPSFFWCPKIRSSCDSSIVRREWFEVAPGAFQKTAALTPLLAKWPRRAGSRSSEQVQQRSRSGAPVVRDTDARAPFWKCNARVGSGGAGP
jgi:hypothetical protein